MQTTTAEKPAETQQIHWKSRKGIKNKPVTRIKQQKVWNDMVQNGKPLTVAMRDNGYKAGYSPAKLAKTKTWQELISKELPDKLLAKVARQGLKTKGKDYYKDMEIRHKYLETSLKMAGKLRDNTDNPGGVNIVVGFKMISPKDREKVIEGETVEEG